MRELRDENIKQILKNPLKENQDAKRYKVFAGLKNTQVQFFWQWCVCTDSLWFNLQSSLKAEICDDTQPQTSSKKNSPNKSETSQLTESSFLGCVCLCVCACVHAFAASLRATFYPFCKPGSESFLSLWKPSVRIFNTWPHQNSNHIREGWDGARGGGVVGSGWGKQGGDGEIERERESERLGETDDHIKPHIPYQKDGWGWRLTAIHPLQPSRFLFVSCISFDHVLAFPIFSSLTVPRAPSVSPLSLL